MPAENVEIVFVIDTSDSMQPYIDALKSNISCLLKPLQQMNYNIRLGIVAHSVTGHGICSIRFLSPCNQSLLKKMYGGQYNIDDFFTQDLDRFVAVVDSLTTQGDEDTLLGIDFALDFPFGSLKDTRRVIAFFPNSFIQISFSLATIAGFCASMMTTDIEVDASSAWILYCCISHHSSSLGGSGSGIQWVMPNKSP